MLAGSVASFASFASATAATFTTFAAANAPPAGDFTRRCESRIGASVASVDAFDHGWSVDNSRSYRALTALKGSGHRHGWVLGLTRAESRIAIGVQGSLLREGAGGRECVAPQLHVRLSYLPIVIYVGKEFAPASCAYEAILRHEMRHLKVYLEQLPKVKARVQQALDRRFGAGGAGDSAQPQPLYAASGQARAALAAEMDQRWMPFMKSAMAETEVLQTAIDSPQEYARLSKVCAGEVQLLLSGKQDR